MIIALTGATVPPVALAAPALPDRLERLVPCLREAMSCEQRHDWIGAASAYGMAIELEPGDPRLYTNLGHALWMADLPHAAECRYRHALKLNSHSGPAWCGLANTLRDLNRFEEADEAYAQASGSEAAWGHAQVLLGLERYGEGYDQAESRHKLGSWIPHWSEPFWGDGSLESLDPREDLWVWSEQGFGDTFQYLRWIPLLMKWRDERAAAMGALRSGELHLVVEPALLVVVREGLAWMVRPPRVVEKQDPAGSSPRNHGPLMSLPHYLGGAPLTEPSAPCLRSPLWSSGGLSLLPSGLPGSPRIGLVWASGRKLSEPYTHREYLKRSLVPGELWRLIDGLQRFGAELVSLQFGDDVELAAAVGRPLAVPLLDLGQFAAAARVLAQLDLVISVDTAMAHLVGTMGLPAWILLPWSADPRWLRNRPDSPWYPSLRLFRQPRTGCWGEVIDQLLKAYGEQYSTSAGC